MRNSSHRSFSASPVAAVALLFSGLSLLLTGCGLGVAAGPVPLDIATNDVSGHAFGGMQAIQGGNVYLVYTGATGYGTGDVIGGTATTSSDQNGSFTITRNGATCTAPQQAYIVIQGGNTGAGLNGQSFLVSAIGSCATLVSTTFVWVNEITTVAAGYALGNFATTDSSAPYIHIGAPSTNSAATGTTSAAAGLPHAFMNAANLAVCCGKSTGGVAQTSPTVSGMVNVTAPATLVNVIADIVQGCINSTGTKPYIVFPAGTGSPATSSVTVAGASDTLGGTFGIIDTPSGGSGSTTNVTVTNGSSIASTISQINAQAGSIVTASASTVNPTTGITLTAVNPTDAITFTGTITNTQNLVDTTAALSETICGSLFSYTPSIAGVFPTNTFQAVANLAKNPWVSASNVTALWALIPTQPAYTPVPSSVPTDYTLALGMSESSSAFPSGTSTVYPYRLVLDANDALYVWNQDAATATTSDLVSTGNYGGTAWNSAATSTDLAARGLAADAIGNLWLPVDTSSTATSLYQIKALDGTLTATKGLASGSGGYAYAIAADRRNNVWIATGIATTNLQELVNTNASPLTAGTYGTKSVVVGVTGTPGTSSSAVNGGGGYGIAVDSFQNIWSADYYGGSGVYGNSVAVLPNVGTFAAPCYTSYNASNTPACATTGYQTPATYQLAGTQPLSVVFDGGSFGTSPATGTYNFNTLATDDYQAVSTTGTTYGVEALNQLAVSETINSGGVLSAPIVAAATNIPASGSTTTGANYTYLQYLAMDGSGYTWAADFLLHNPVVTKGTTILSEPNGFNPCIQTAAAACPASGSMGNIRTGAIDSTGSYWVTSSSTTVSKAGVFQIIGTPSPAWPLLSLGLWGVEP